LIHRADGLGLRAERKQGILFSAHYPSALRP
jgi:hypothetical protein